MVDKHPITGALDRRGKGVLLPTTRVLDLSSTESDVWNLVHVSVPTLIYPYRNDGLTGSPLNNVVLKYLDISYSPIQPVAQFGGFIEGGQNQDQIQAYRAGPRGVCHLWHPGDWWVIIRTGHGGGAGFIGKIPFWTIPCPDPQYAHLIQGMGMGSLKARHFRQTYAAGLVNQQILSVQEIIEGISAVDMTSSRFDPLVAYAWRGSDPATLGMPYSSNFVYRFEGNTLPISDLAITNGSGAGITIALTLYY